MNAVLEEVLEKSVGEEPEKKRILFVCTGNTCRSPMAAALYNAKYADPASHAVSAGLAADGSGISRNAILALLDMGIRSAEENDYLSHVSHTVTETDMEKADLVIGMTGRHAMRLLMLYPAYASKITAMPADIADPYGGDGQAYRSCLEQIDRALAEMFLPEEDGNG
ncbi:MAG: low molecular weight protein arginine phosphatase [Clostridia bacterium]|nr:low molecular weight protein arginine phosphatase [Clostridia bacterium]